MRFFSRLVTGVALAAATGASAVVLLNDPEEKRTLRLKTLKNLQGKMKAMIGNSLLKDQAPKLETAIAKIDKVFEMQTEKKDDKQLDDALAEVKVDIEDLKRDLMKKAMELQSEQAKLIRSHSSRVQAEAAFDKLMEVQDAPIAEQLKVLEDFKDDGFVKKFMDKHSKDLKEGTNLAMAFGEAMDHKVDDEKHEAEEADLTRLESTAHLSRDQAQSLMPILAKVRDQKLDKERRLHEVSSKLDSLQETERFYKKHKAMLAKEKGILTRAIFSIEHGKVQDLGKAMKELQEIGV